MNILKYDDVFRVFNDRQVDFVLIGGLNFFLNYEPVATRDIDVFVGHERGNLERCESALAELNAQWGASDLEWGDVKEKSRGWLGGQSVYCLLCDAGELDVFTRVAGLDSLGSVLQRSTLCQTNAGTQYRSLAREDMLACQMAIPEQYRRKDRIEFLMRHQDEPDSE